MPFVACKLPNGLEISHEGKTIVLHGANIGEDLENVSRNGAPTDNALRSYGYGFTELSDANAQTFQNWCDFVTYKGGDKANGKLADPFLALENGSILGPFKTKDEAVKEVTALHAAVRTGMEGLEPAAEGIEDAETDEGQPTRKTRKPN